MPDEILEVGARVDVSSVGSGMQEAASEVADATDQMSSSFDKVAVATRSYAVAQQNLRATLKETITGQLAYVGGLQGEEIRTKAVAEAISTASSAKRALTEATRAQSQAEGELATRIEQEARGQEMANAITKQATEASLAHALGLRAEGEAAQQASEGLGGTRRASTAATGALRELEGGIPIRTLSSFASQSAALAPILEAAFPVIGVIALGEFVVQLSGKFTELYNQVVNYSDEAATALKEEEALDKQFEKSIDVSDRLRQKVAELTAGRKALRDAGYDPNSGKAPSAAQLKQEEAGEKKGRDTNKAADDENNLAILNRQAVEVGEKMGKLQSIVDGVTYGNRQLAAIKLTPLVEQYDNLQQAIKNATSQKSIDEAESAKDGMRLASEQAQASAQAARQNAAAARAAAAERKRLDSEEVRSWEEALQRQQLDAGAFYQTQTRDAMAYWANILEQQNLSATQRAEVEKKYLTARNQTAKESLGDWVEAKKEEIAEQAKTSETIITLYQSIQAAMVDAYGAGSKQAIEAQREVIKATNEVAEAQDRANKAAAEAAAKQRKPQETAQTGIVQQAGSAGSDIDKKAKQQVDAGIISQRQYQQAVQQTEDGVYAIQLAALQKRRALEAQDPNGPEETAKTDNEIQKLTQQHEQRITDIQQQQIAIRAKNMNAYFAQFGTAVSNSFSAWEHGQSSFTAAFGKSLGSMATQLQSYLAQQGAKWVAHEAFKLEEHIRSAIMGKTVDATVATTTATQNAVVNAATILSYATVASAAAFASTAAIPVVGIGLAPAAATTAYATVAAMAPLASAAGGWDMVPYDGALTELHKNEMVLSAPLADGVRKMSGQGGGAKTITQHFGGNTFNGAGGEDFPAMLDKHEDALSAKMKSLMRDGKL